MKRFFFAMMMLLAARMARAAQCNDGIDNDGDGLVDWQYDLGCTSQTDDSEGGRPTGTVEDGWTVFEPSADTKIIYVSNSTGDDSWDGTSPVHIISTSAVGPKKTVSAGSALMRAGSPDWLLLRRGDSWTGGLSGKSGRSATEPMLVASYGASTARPVLVGANLSISGVSHFALSGISRDLTASGGSTIDVSNSQDVLIEGCRMDGGQYHSIYMDKSADVRVRRNVSVKPRSSGFYVSSMTNPLIEENVLYRPAQSDDNHAMYITHHGNQNVVTRGNLVLMDKPTINAGYAIMQRSGGLTEGNVVVGAAWAAIEMGECNDGDGGPSGTGDCYGGVPVTVRGNLFLDGKGGGGLAVVGPLPGAVVEDNIFSNMPPGSAIGASKGCQGGFCMVPEVLNLTIQRNVFYNAQTGQREAENVVWRDNRVYMNRDELLMSADEIIVTTITASGNWFYSPVHDPRFWFGGPGLGSVTNWNNRTGDNASGMPFSFTDPTRTLASYNAALGGAADREVFFQEAALQSKFNWRPAYAADAVIAYFRAGFSTGSADTLPPARPRNVKVR